MTPLNTIESLTRKYVSVTSHCWNWTGKIAANGYGHCKLDRKTQLAHRAFFSALVGAIPTGLQIDHLCFNKKCVNPDHLEAVTPRENTLRADGPGARNAQKTHCSRGGHLLAGENLYVDPRGKRNCRTCTRELEVDRKMKKAVA